MLSKSKPRKVGDLELRVETDDGRVLLGLNGRITIDSSPDLRNQLLAILSDANLQQVMIDLTCVSYIDLSGIATFIEALKIARAAKTGLLLTGLQDRPRYLLDVAGLLPLFMAASDAGADDSSKGQE